MKAEFFNLTEDFPHYVLWCRERNRLYPDKNFLPINGVTVKHDDGRHLAMAFLYITDAGFGSIGNVMTRASNGKILNREAVLLAISFLVNTGKALKLGYVSTVTNNDRLIGFYEELGFKKGELGLTQLFSWG